MGTLTKKLHVLKSGGTEETCNIYTTPEEVGGSPYLALEVDGQKGYVKLGSTTDANATHLRVEKNGTTYAAWKQAGTPTGQITISGAGTFTVPSGIHVIQLSGDFNTIYVGVTPNTTHSFYINIDQQGHFHFEITVGCRSHNKIYDEYSFITDGDKEDPIDTIRISWSPEINKKTPTTTDY